ncbi:MAG: prepilin-type N-terminal cleavage/methylation domain-containing protein [Candidatus Omnitrophota bacterium]
MNFKNGMAGARAGRLSRGGFSLIEILLGLALFSIVALILYNVFFGGIKVNRKSESASQMYREARWAFDRITSDLENMVPYDFSNSYPGSLAFSGGSNGFELLLATGTGLERVRYSLQSPDLGHRHQIVIGKHFSENAPVVIRREEEGAPQRTLIRDQIPFVDSLSPGQEENVRSQILCSGLIDGGLQFKYARQSDEGKRMLVWEEEWGKEYFPVGVKVRLTFREEDGGGVLTLEKDVLLPKSFPVRLIGR